jgi:hypothetical protein
MNKITKKNIKLKLKLKDEREILYLTEFLVNSIIMEKFVSIDQIISLAELDEDVRCILAKFVGYKKDKDKDKNPNKIYIKNGLLYALNKLQFNLYKDKKENIYVFDTPIKQIKKIKGGYKWIELKI